MVPSPEVDLSGYPASDSVNLAEFLLKPFTEEEVRISWGNMDSSSGGGTGWASCFTSEIHGSMHSAQHMKLYAASGQGA